MDAMNDAKANEGSNGAVGARRTTGPTGAAGEPRSPVALVTGASRGLGLALARALAGRGWRLLVDGRDSEALEAARAELATIGSVVAVAGDVGDPAHRAAMARAAVALGGVDAVVNNAGALGPSPLPRLLDLDLEDLGDVLHTNVVAPLGLIQALADELRPGARIVTITSDAARGAWPGWGAYGASKAALEQLSNVLAAELPDVAVYCVDPGDMRTDMHQDAFPGEDISDRPPPEASVPGLLALIDPPAGTDTPLSGRYEARALATA